MQYTSKEVYEFVSKQSKDPIVEWKKCRLSWQEFPIYQSDLESYDKISPVFEVSESYAKEFFERNSDLKDNFEYKDGKLKAKIPTPTLCPEERERRRYAFRNENNLYKRKCDFSWKSIISMYSPDKEYKVFDQEFRRWDSRNPLDYWFSYTWNFKSDFSLLLKKTPVIGKFIIDGVNSSYTNHILRPKDSYLCFNSVGIEDCMYMREWDRTKYCFNCDYVIRCEHCADCVQCYDCFNTFNCLHCYNCSFCNDCEKCTDCHYCLDCYNIENKSYCINNVQYTKQEYEKMILSYKKNHKDTKIVLWCSQKWCENSYWNDLTNCKNCSFFYESFDCSDSKYFNRQIQLENCMDLQWYYEQLTIEWISTTNSYHWWFMFYWDNNKESWYYSNCYNCSNIFGCIWLKNKEYCILNKEYSKEEYNKLVPQIIAEMMRNYERGEFFDPKLSYYGYNETIAMDYYPLTKEDALNMWYKWSDYEAPAPKVEKIVLWANLPKVWCKVIQEKKPEFLQKIVNYAIICEVSKKPFRITKQEIDFYVKHNLPIPTKHPDIRHQERLKRKDPTTMHLIHCDECGEEMLSVHLPWKWKKILCEKCFYKEK